MTTASWTTIDVGTVAEDGTGTPARTIFQNLNVFGPAVVADLDAAGDVKATSTVANTTNAIAFDFDTANQLTGSGAKLQSWSNNGTEYAYMSKTGDLIIPVARITTTYVVSGLPTSLGVGTIARVSDADTPAIGSTVTGGSTSAALVWYNGTNWTVIGV